MLERMQVDPTALVINLIGGKLAIEACSFSTCRSPSELCGVCVVCTASFHVHLASKTFWSHMSLVHLNDELTLGASRRFVSNILDMSVLSAHVFADNKM